MRRHPTLLLSVDTVKADVARAALDAGRRGHERRLRAFGWIPRWRAVAAEAERGPRAHALARDHPRDRLVHPRRVRATWWARWWRSCGGRWRRPRRRAWHPGPRWSTLVSASRRRGSRISCCSTGSRRSRRSGRPVLVGPSRKRFLGAVTGQPVEARDRATATACALAWERARGSSGCTTSPRRATPSRSRRLSEVRSAPRAAAVPHAGLAGPARDPDRRIRHLCAPPLSRRHPRPADRARAAGADGDLPPRVPAQAVDDHLPAGRGIHLRRVRGAGGVPAGAPAGARAAGTVAASSGSSGPDRAGVWRRRSRRRSSG